jgi:hypothetical protein
MLPLRQITLVRKRNVQVHVKTYTQIFMENCKLGPKMEVTWAKRMVLLWKYISRAVCAYGNWDEILYQLSHRDIEERLHKIKTWVEVIQRRGYEWNFVSSAMSPKNFWHFFTKCRLRVLKEIPYLGISNVHSRALITAVLQIIFFNRHY